MTKKKHPRHFENEAAREAYARAWLIYLGVDPAPERIQEIVPFVDDHEPRSPLAHIANHLIIQGKLPTRKAVNHEQEQRHQKQHAQRVKTLEKLAIDTATVEEARTWVATFVQEHGEGPLWSELGRHLGWASKDIPFGVRELARRGAIRYTPVRRSMRPGRSRWASRTGAGTGVDEAR